MTWVDAPMCFFIINSEQIWCINFVTVCSYHVTYAFQSESTLYSCLNVKELLARSRREIWSLSDYNWTRTHNHLAYKRTLNFRYKLSGCGFESSCSQLTLYFGYDFQYVTLCLILQFQKREKYPNTYGKVLLLIKLQAKACNLTESNTPPCVFFTPFKLYK